MFEDEAKYPRDQPEGQSYLRAKAVADQYEKDVLEANPRLQKDKSAKAAQQAGNAHWRLEKKLKWTTEAVAEKKKFSKKYRIKFKKLL